MQVCGGREKSRAYRRRTSERRTVMRSAWYVRLARAAAGCAGATAVRSLRRSGSLRRRRCSRGSSSAATVAKDRSVAQDVERLPAGARAVRASWFGVPAGADEAWPPLDAAARAALAPLPAGEPDPIALVRESTIGGAFVGLAAVDGLAPHVLLRSGRLPRACTPERCEVLRLRGAGRLPDVPGLRVVAGRHGDAPLAPALRRLPRADRQRARGRRARAGARPAPARYHRPPPGPLVVAEGVAGLVSSPVLARSYRELRLGRSRSSGGTPRLWEIDRLVGDADRARAELQASSTSWSLTLPDAGARGGASATRPSRDAGCCSSAARRPRCSSRSPCSRRARSGATSRPARRRLTWHGARRWQRAPPDRDGERGRRVRRRRRRAGWSAASVGARRGRASPARRSAPSSRRACSRRPGSCSGSAVAVLAALVIAVTVSLEPGRAARVGPLELAAVAARRRGRSPSSRAARSTRDELAAGGVARRWCSCCCRGSSAFAAAVGRVAAAPGGGSRCSPGAARAGARLAGVSLARSPGAAGIAAAFLALAVGLAVLAEAYRSTLRDGERDQAAYAVPADVVVREDLRALVPVLRAAPLRRYESLPGVEAAHPVVRATASAGPAAAVSGVTVLGVPRGGDPRDAALARATGARSRRARADAIAPDGATALRGACASPEPRLRLAVGPGLALVPRDGRAARRLLPDARARRRGRRPPDGPRGGTAGRRARRPARRDHPRARRGIVERGADAGVALRGRRRSASWTGRSTAGSARAASTVSARHADTGAFASTYAVTPQRTARVRPRQPTDDAPPARRGDPGARASSPAAWAAAAAADRRRARSTSRSPPSSSGSRGRAGTR